MNMLLFNIVFALIFFSVIGGFIYMIFDSLKTKIKNDNSPRLTVPATVVAKRADVSSHHHSGMNENSFSHVHYSTSYYVTFQVTSGDRIELCIPENVYGYMVEGDYGNLSFQGTRFLGFERVAFQ